MKQALLILLLLSSCSILKHTTKSQTKTDTQTETKAEEKTEKEKETKSKTVTTEKADTLIHLPESTLTGEGALDTIPVTLEDDNQKVVVTPDGKGNIKIKATIKPKAIPVKIDKKTVRDEEIKETVKIDSSGQETKHQYSEEKKSDREVKKTGLLIPWYWWLVLVLIAVGYVLYRVYIKRK